LARKRNYSCPLWATAATAVVRWALQARTAAIGAVRTAIAAARAGCTSAAAAWAQAATPPPPRQTDSPCAVLQNFKNSINLETGNRELVRKSVLWFFAGCAFYKRTIPYKNVKKLFFECATGYFFYFLWL
jgi:hypothetical protein